MADEQECLRDLEGEIGEQEGAEGETQRLTAQWSVEDEEEAARERRRRERERQLRSQAEEGLNSTSEVAVQESRIDGKPPGTLELEEDEGFSDWSQKLEQLKQRSGGEGVQERDQILQGECRETQESDPIQCEESPRSPRCSYEEEDGNLKEAEVMLDQVNLDQETPTFIRFETGPSNFLKFVSTSTSEDQPEAELEQQQQLRETLEFGEENQHAEDMLQEYVTEEDKPEEEEEKQEDNKRQYEQEVREKRQRTPSTSSQEDECQTPLSPTLKITDRTESFNRSVQKSNSMKKTQAPLPVSKIDDKLEQYTQAIEFSSKTPKPARQASIDLPTNSAAVASTKSLWETGEVTQSTKSLPCKDIVAGDIVNIRSLWEQKESPQTDANAKVKIPGKKYKYVAVGHGQYKRVPIEDDGVTEK
ncbi:lymphocyte-specific protein 1 isoform X1 [Notechis scutatus]|uniref:Lymphocyte-specific protein 1 isoform X1 n=1 Tax=Notechis scutatus TaxID=8663 RepID=A0A6J1U609_9SAUR|nr:lymphocyte-specific protein 1 isoform X1 [Notechis scutatus]XP_026524042.1 lymphocyte-specific protein 1 isoform X1 [Notechis scutatus]XP_026524043.1 lymphocyte-specific protein 1 isoform X1 [Notechis scutatus]XP_026524044.1 lymphocyte-specific protein 1 isoform X1 [Notechis scutatus]